MTHPFCNVNRDVILKEWPKVYPWQHDNEGEICHPLGHAWASGGHPVSWETMDNNAPCLGRQNCCVGLGLGLCPVAPL